MRFAVAISILLLLAGCGKNERKPEVAKSEPQETIQTPQGASYLVTRVPGIKIADLPMNNDLKMADRDLAKYAETACTLDVPLKLAQTRCDLYVQSDPNGTLIGYAAVTQDVQGVSFNTATTINEKKEPGGKACDLGGKLTVVEGGDKVVSDAGKDFDGEFMYSAWERDPGVWLVSPAETSGAVDPDHPLGVWYVSKSGDKLRISQERWNYCYADSSVNVDDVFYRAVSLTKTTTKA